MTEDTGQGVFTLDLGGGCMLHEKCFGSSHCSKYRVVAVAETRVRNTNETYQPRNNKPLDERGKRKFKREKTPVTVQGIQLGDTVELLDTVDGFKMKVHIVEKEKACLEDNKISEDSPIGRAVLGKKKGDRIEIFTNKKVVYEIIE